MGVMGAEGNIQIHAFRSHLNSRHWLAWWNTHWDDPVLYSLSSQLHAIDPKALLMLGTVARTPDSS